MLKLKDLGCLHYFPEIEVIHTIGGDLFLWQTRSGLNHYQHQWFLVLNAKQIEAKYHDTAAVIVELV